MERDREFDEVLRRKISETLDEPLDESINADDLMFDLGMRYLRLMASQKRINAYKRKKQLSLWVEDTASKNALVRYVDAVTSKNSPDYIPPNDRIAVFDLDGTLYCESDPTWFDFMICKHRILEDPDYKDKATEYEKSIANTVQSVIDTGVVPEGFEVEVGSCCPGFCRHDRQRFFLLRQGLCGKAVTGLRRHDHRRRVLPAHGSGHRLPAGQGLHRLCLQRK